MRLQDILDYQARERPDARFAVQGDRGISYREAGAETNRLANALIGRGLRPGDRIAVLAKNSIEYASSTSPPPRRAWFPFRSTPGSRHRSGPSSSRMRARAC